MLVAVPCSEGVPPLIFRLMTRCCRLRSTALLSGGTAGCATKTNSSEQWRSMRRHSPPQVDLERRPVRQAGLAGARALPEAGSRSWAANRSAAFGLAKALAPDREHAPASGGQSGRRPWTCTIRSVGTPRGRANPWGRGFRGCGVLGGAWVGWCSGISCGPPFSNRASSSRSRACNWATVACSSAISASSSLRLSDSRSRMGARYQTRPTLARHTPVTNSTPKLDLLPTA